MRITLVISSLGSGGAERVMSMLASQWATKGWPVTLITLDDGNNDFYPLPPAITRVALDVMNPSSNPVSAVFHNIRRVSRLRSALRKSTPQVVLSFVDRTNVLVLLTAWGLRVPVVVSERTNPPAYPLGLAWEALRRLAYPKAKGLVLQTEGLKPWGEKRVKKGRVFIVPNPVILPDARETGLPKSLKSISLKKGRQRVVAVGRFGHEKGFDLLLEGFGRLASGFSGWDLVILGDGPLRPNLTRQVEGLGLHDRVFLPGRVKNPFPVLAGCDLFVLSSRFEGFPNVLLEAMACGLPVVAFDCPSGPADIIHHGVDGLLVPAGDVGKLAEAMQSLMENPEERVRLGDAAKQVTGRFSMEKVAAMWESVLAQVVLPENPS